MNECFTDPIFGNFSVERKRKVSMGKRQEEKLRERLVIQLAVTCKLLKNTI